MERVLSSEEKIKRAEEIYNRRKIEQSKTGIAKVNIREKKDLKLLKKMMIQIIICFSIYSVFYLIKNNNYIFSQDFVNYTKEILSYDIDFESIYNKFIEFVNSKQETTQDRQEDNIEETIDDGMGGSEENKEENNEQISEQSQMEQNAISIKNSISFINPIEGTITSKFGWREPTSSNVPKYHTGLDIANVTGTKILSATDGEVVLVSSKGDYGNHLKIQINDVVVIYAHCNAIYVTQGEKIIQGQEIAEVGSTGNSTGPHLHFEIRKDDRLVDPQLVLNI